MNLSMLHSCVYYKVLKPCLPGSTFLRGAYKSLFSFLCLLQGVEALFAYFDLSPRRLQGLRIDDLRTWVGAFTTLVIERLHVALVIERLYTWL